MIGEGIRMKQWLWAVVGAVALAGCASSGKNGVKEAVVQVKEDKVARVKTVEFAPQLIDCGRAAQ